MVSTVQLLSFLESAEAEASAALQGMDAAVAKLTVQKPKASQTEIDKRLADTEAKLAQTTLQLKEFEISLIAKGIRLDKTELPKSTSISENSEPLQQFEAALNRFQMSFGNANQAVSEFEDAAVKASYAQARRSLPIVVVPALLLTLVYTVFTILLSLAKGQLTFAGPVWIAPLGIIVPFVLLRLPSGWREAGRWIYIASAGSAILLGLLALNGYESYYASIAFSALPDMESFAHELESYYTNQGFIDTGLLIAAVFALAQAGLGLSGRFLYQEDKRKRHQIPGAEENALRKKISLLLPLAIFVLKIIALLLSLFIGQSFSMLELAQSAIPTAVLCLIAMGAALGNQGTGGCWNLILRSTYGIVAIILLLPIFYSIVFASVDGLSIASNPVVVLLDRLIDMFVFVLAVSMLYASKSAH